MHMLTTSYTLPKSISVFICAHSEKVIVVGNGHGDTSSSPGWGWLYFT